MRATFSAARRGHLRRLRVFCMRCSGCTGAALPQVRAAGCEPLDLGVCADSDDELERVRFPHYHYHDYYHYELLLGLLLCL